MEKEYVVVVKAGVDLAAFDAELAATTGEGTGIRRRSFVQKNSSLLSQPLYSSSMSSLSARLNRFNLPGTLW